MEAGNDVQELIAFAERLRLAIGGDVDPCLSRVARLNSKVQNCVRQCGQQSQAESHCAKLQSGFSLFDLKTFVHERMVGSNLQIQAVTDVQPTATPTFQITNTVCSEGFQVATPEIAGEF